MDTLGASTSGAPSSPVPDILSGGIGREKSARSDLWESEFYGSATSPLSQTISSQS